MTLFVDCHEPAEIAQSLKKKGLAVEIKSLQSGDYVFSNIGIERKTFNDYKNSLSSGRLWKQVFNLREVFERPMLVIDKTPDDIYWDDLDRRRIMSSVARIVKMGVSVVFLTSSTNMPTSESFIELVSWLFIASGQQKAGLKPVPKKGERMTTTDVTEDMLCMLPGIGREIAKEIILRYPTLELLVQAKIEDLKIIPKIGGKKAIRLYNVLHYPNRKFIEDVPVQTTRVIQA